jgi:putative tryptophan/tyrosine transport system substrate-binding protein
MRLIGLMVVLAGSLLLALLTVGTQPLAKAQEARKTPRIGFLGATTPAGYAGQIEAMRAGFRDLGYVEGQTILVEYRWAEGLYERLPDLAKELVGLKVDLIVTHGVPGVSAAKNATSTIPIVMAIVGDAVAFGLVTNVVRPDANVTGSSFFGPEIIAKRLEILKELAPNISRVALLFNPDNRAARAVLNELMTRAQALGIKLQYVEVRKASELDQSFATIARQQTPAAVIVDDPVLISHARQIAAIAAKHRIPAIGFKEFVQAGGLACYAVDHLRVWRQTAVFVDKILKGAKPSDLPINQATHFELIVNLKTAKTLSLTIPQSVLVRAEEIIQ